VTGPTTDTPSLNFFYNLDLVTEGTHNTLHLVQRDSSFA
jgi:hypothetical protein